MKKNFSKVLALFLAVIMSLPLACFASLGIFAEGEGDDVVTETNPTYTEPTVSSEAVAYWAYTGNDTNNGLTPATAKKTFSSLWPIIKPAGGTVVINGKGFVSQSLSVSSGGGTLLITGKDIDGTYYYDPVTPNVDGKTGQTGMIMIAAKGVLTFKSDVIFDNVGILQRSCTTPANAAAIKISNNATMVIGENTLFLKSTDAVVNSKLIVDAGSNLIVKAAGALAYEGTGNIFIDKNLVGNGIDASQFANFEGKVYDLDGNSACDIVGHTYKLNLIDHEYRNVCTACGDNVPYSYTLPTLTNTTDAVYWANGSKGDGSSVESPKEVGAAVASALGGNGGTVYIVGKGYIGATVSINYGGTTQITSVTPDGTDYRGIDYTGVAHPEDGSVFAPADAVITFADSIIFEKTAIFSRSTNAPIYKFSNNAVIYFDETNFGKTAGNYPALLIDKGTTVVINEKCTGAISSITGEGTLILDMKAVQSGIVTGKAVEGFKGTIMTTDCKEVCAFTGSHNYVDGTCNICGTVQGTAITKIYVAADGTGDGLTPENPTYSIRRGFEYASADPIEIILVDDLKISSGIACQAQTQDVTITSVDLDGDGVYPKLIIQSFINFYNEGSGNTITFENIEIQSDRSGTVSFFMNYNNLVIGDNVTCTLSGNYTTAETGIGVYPTIYAGFLESGGENTVAAKSNDNDCTITVNSGTWRMLRGGNRRNAAEYVIGNNSGDLTININGGTFIGHEESNFAITGTGENFASGNIAINITGGVIQGDIYGVDDINTYSGDTAFGEYGFKGDITIDVSGGNLSGNIYAKAENIRIPALIRGNVDVIIGADVVLDDVITIDLRGTQAYAGQNKISTATIDDTLVESVICKFVDEVNGTATNAGEPIRIAFVGDSITQGTGSGDNRKYSYPAQLRDMLNSDEYMVGNFGVGASGVLPTTRYYYNATLQYKLIMEEFDPAIVSFALGTNDALTAGGTKGAANDFETRYYNMIKGVADLATVEKVYVATPLLRLDLPSRGARNASIIEPAIRSIVADLKAEGYNATLFELNANTYEAVIAGQVLGTDNLHPNADGYSVMAEAFYNAIFNDIVDVPEGFYIDTFYVSDNGTVSGAGTAEDPSTLYYLGLSRLNKNGGTIVILDSYTIEGDVMTPVDIAKLTIVGESADATLNFGGSTFKLGSDTEIDNLIFNTTALTPYIVCWYNDLTIGENFTNVTAEGKTDLSIVAGYFVYEDPTLLPDTTTYDTVESASDAKDMTLIVKNGTFGVIMLGNRRLSQYSPIGTYSGNMTVQLLGGTITGNAESNVKTCLLAMNYLTGNINVTIDGMSVEGASYIVSRTATLTKVTYDSANNTGSITLNAKATILDKFIENERPNASDKQHAEIANVALVSTTALGDLDDDGAFANADVTLLVRYLSGFAVNGARYTADVNGDGKINNRDAIALIQNIGA